LSVFALIWVHRKSSMKCLTSLAAAAAILIAGCSTPRLGGSPNLAVVSADALPPPNPSDLVTPSRAHLIGPYDRLSVEVLGLPDLTRTVQVDTAGQISYPMVGTISVAGSTASGLADTLREALRARYIRDPQVTVNVSESPSQTFTVDGQVEEPGPYPIVGRMTLMRAVARAQGTSEFASLRYVVVFRTVGGQQMAALYDLAVIRNGAYDDPAIFANDVVVVGESQARRLFRDILQSTPLLSAPIIALMQRQ
jgi:polysaccharide export outer membrane protein